MNSIPKIFIKKNVCSKTQETSRKVRDERKIKNWVSRDTEFRNIIDALLPNMKKVLEEAANDGQNIAYFDVHQNDFKNIVDDYDVCNVVLVVISRCINEHEELDGLKFKVDRLLSDYKIRIVFTW